MNSAQTQDPFRFLKRIKKDFTPQKDRPSKAPSLTEIPASITSISKGQSMDSSINQSTISKMYGRGFTTRAPYDPNKYYSKQCQDYLKKINIRQHPQYRQFEVMKNAQYRQFEVVKKPQYRQFEGMQKVIQQQPKIKKVQKVLSYEQQFKTDNKKNSQRSRQYKQVVSQITFKKIDFEHVQGHIGHFSKHQNMDLEFFQEEQQMAEGKIQLRECNICLRNFNPNSYEKHIKVCEKVFMKKRKPFSSEKQRSQSKEKKKN